MFRRSPVLLLLAATVCFALPLFAAAQPDIAALERGADSRKYPDAANILLYDREEINCKADGTYVSSDVMIYKVLTEAGRRDLRENLLYFNSNYGSADFAEAYIWRKGVKIPVDVKKNSTLSTSAGQMQSNIYDPEMKVRKLTVPELEKGDVFYLKVCRSNHKPVIPGEFSTIISLESDVPILFYEVKINMPESLPLVKRVIKNPVSGTVKSFEPVKKDGIITYLWQARNVPQAIPEPGMPKLYTCCQRLLLGTTPDWQSISSWYYKLCRPRMDAVSDGMKQSVAELVKGAKDDDEKINRIFRYVSQNIRYAGVTAEKNAPGFEPHDVKDTFEQKHGVCRDKAALLASMLELAGLKAFPVLFMAGNPKDDDVPNGYFNHAVVAVDRGKFDYVLMDPTDENTRTIFPEYLSNQSYLVARAEGDVLRRSPVISPERNRMGISTSGSIDGTGTLSGSCRITYSGINDLIYRSAFARWTPEKRREFWQGRLRRAIPGATLGSFTVKPDNIRDTSSALSVDFSFQAANAVSYTNACGILQTPQFSGVFGTLDWILPDMSREKRRFPVELDSTCLVDEKFELVLAPHLVPDGIPSGKEGKAGVISWQSGMKVEKNKLSGSFVTRLSGVTVEPENYRSFRETLQHRSHAAKHLPVIGQDNASLEKIDCSKIYPDAEAVTLEAKERLFLEDAKSYTSQSSRRVKVLNYAGVKNYSELKFSSFPAREKLSVTGRVIQPDGTVREISEADIRVMDAPWCASIKHLDPEKITVVALGGVQPGAIIEYGVKRSGKSIYPVAGSRVVAGHTPTLNWSFEIDFPRELKLKYSDTPARVRRDRTSRGNRTLIKWSGRNFPAQPRESGQPELRFFAPEVSFSAIDARKECRGLLDLMRKRASFDNDDVWRAFKAKQGSGFDALTTKDKAVAIRDFAARAVRVAGPGVGNIAPEKISTPDEAFNRGAATSLERAVMLSGLFDKAGIKHEFFLASDYPFVKSIYGTFAGCFEMVFDTVLLYVPELSAYFNCSGEYAVCGSTNCNGKLGVKLDGARLSAISATASNADEIRFKSKVFLNPDGSAHVAVTKVYGGRIFEQQHRKLAEFTPELLRRYFEREACMIDEAAKLDGKYTFDFSSGKGVVNFSFTTPRFAAVSGNYLTFTVPGHDLLRGLAAVSGSERKTPWMRSSPLRVIVSCTVTVPAGYTAGETSNIRRSYGDNRMAQLVENRETISREMRFNYKLELPATLVQPEDFDRLIQVQNALEKASSSTGAVVKVKK